MLAKTPETFSELAVIRGDHATFACGEKLSRVEREHREARIGTDRSSPIRRSDCASCILDQTNAALRAELAEAIEIAGHPDLVRSDNRPGPIRSRRANSFDSHVLSGQIHIGEYRPRTNISRCVAGGDERQRRDYYVVAWSYLEREKREM